MKKLSAYFILITLLFSSKAFSANVIKVKGISVLVNTDGEQIRKGQLYYLISKEGKKKGILKIKKVKSGKAIGTLLKGKALKSWTLRLRPSKKRYTKKRVAPKIKRVTNKRRDKKSRKYKTKRKYSLGFVAGYNSNSSEVIFLDPSGAVDRPDSYKGTSFSYDLLLDYPIRKKFHLRGMLGSHSFFTEDSSNTRCYDSNGAKGAVCRVDLSYISLDGWLRYYFTQGKNKIWGGAGLKVLFSPSFNSTTALNQEDIGTEVIPQIGAGVDFKLSDRLYVPIWGQYAFTPSTDTVKGSSMSLYFGLAYRM